MAFILTMIAPVIAEAKPLHPGMHA